ncbi:hypothetical protein B0H34DRAFT_670916 [Crassisporium funariophilum]|nr:hypothetical protein B0H34DRAFT_670916 [Crassisporium funariophilum]
MPNLQVLWIPGTAWCISSTTWCFQTQSASAPVLLHTSGHPIYPVAVEAITAALPTHVKMCIAFFRFLQLNMSAHVEGVLSSTIRFLHQELCIPYHAPAMPAATPWVPPSNFQPSQTASQQTPLVQQTIQMQPPQTAFPSLFTQPGNPMQRINVQRGSRRPRPYQNTGATNQMMAPAVLTHFQLYLLPYPNSKNPFWKILQGGNNSTNGQYINSSTLLPMKDLQYDSQRLAHVADKFLSPLTTLPTLLVSAYVCINGPIPDSEGLPHPCYASWVLWGFATPPSYNYEFLAKSGPYCLSTCPSTFPACGDTSVATSTFYPVTPSPNSFYSAASSANATPPR